MRTPVVSTGGMQISGLDRILGEFPAVKGAPLVIALHGGGYTATYFDVPGYSLLERSAALNVPIVALDRPGYGDSTPLPPADASIARNADVLDEAIAKIWRDRGAGRGVFLIGHSIGGAITIAIAARRPSWPLCGIAVSGVGLHTPRDLEIRTAALPDIPMITRPSPMKDVVMFGPPWTYDDAMPQASHIADAPVPRREIVDITSWWNKHVRALAASVTVPVHYRQGEFDSLWVNGPQEVAAFGAAFTAAPAVDARPFASSGHCIDFHRSSGAFQLDQLAFALRCATDPALYRH